MDFLVGLILLCVFPTASLVFGGSHSTVCFPHCFSGIWWVSFCCVFSHCFSGIWWVSFCCVFFPLLLWYLVGLILPCVFPLLPWYLTSLVPYFFVRYFVTSLVAQTVKRLPAMRETRVQSLGWEDPLEKEMATHSSILAWKIPWTEEGYSPWGRRESDTTDFYAKDVGSSS